MCLLVSQEKTTKLSDELLTEVFMRNSDGIGVMWAENGSLFYKKEIPRNADDFLKFYHANIAGKKCAWHARMMTHGDIDLENCHPYSVFGFDKGDGDVPMPMLLMHNGILSTGNWKDKTKSDTWHYIRDFLRPMLKGNEGFAFTTPFKKIVSKHITDSNRFAIMNNLGELTILNEDTGVYYQDAWFSNTYAWDATKYLPASKRYGGYRGYSDWGTDDDAYKNWMDERSVHGTHGKSYVTTAGATVGLDTETPAPKKSKNQLKREAKTLARIARRNKTTTPGGTVIPLGGPTTQLSLVKDSGEQEVLDSNGGDEVGSKFKAANDTIKQDWVDDVLEMRAILDHAYPDNPTKDTQMQMLLEVMGPTNCYFALELLNEGRMSTGMWNRMAASPTAAKMFVTLDKKKFDEIKEGKFNNRGHAVAAPETEGMLQ